MCRKPEPAFTVTLTSIVSNLMCCRGTRGEQRAPATSWRAGGMSQLPPYSPNRPIFSDSGRPPRGAAGGGVRVVAPGRRCADARDAELHGGHVLLKKADGSGCCRNQAHLESAIVPPIVQLAVTNFSVHCICRLRRNYLTISIVMAEECLHSDCKLNTTLQAKRKQLHLRPGRGMFRTRSSAAKSKKLMRSVGSQRVLHILISSAATRPSKSYLSRSESYLLPFARILKATIHCIIP
jgi:hypothetical protein